MNVNTLNEINNGFLLDRSASREITWNHRIIAKIEEGEEWVNHKLSAIAKMIKDIVRSVLYSMVDGVDDFVFALISSCHSMPTRIDQLTSSIQKKFSHLTHFNEWLDSNGHGSWYRQLATFLVKLPARSIRNIIATFYHIIKTALYAPFYPIQTAFSLAKGIITLIHELTLPETWSKIGVGLIGTTLGQACMVATLLSVISLGIGIALGLGGVALGTLKTMLTAERLSCLEAVKQYLLSQSQTLAESLLTSFCIGLVLGSIQQKHKELHQKAYEEAKKNYTVNILNPEGRAKASEFINEYIKQNDLPPTNYMLRDNDNGTFYAVWYNHQKIFEKVPIFENVVDPSWETSAYEFRFRFAPNSPPKASVIFLLPRDPYWDSYNGQWVTNSRYFHLHDVSDAFNLKNITYPLPPRPPIPAIINYNAAPVGIPLALSSKQTNTNKSLCQA